MDAIGDYYANIEQLPVVSKVEPGYLAKLVPGKDAGIMFPTIPELSTILSDFPPEIGEPFTDIEADF